MANEKTIRIHIFFNVSRDYHVTKNNRCARTPNQDDFVSELKKENRLLDEGFPLPKYNIEQHIKWMDDNNVSTSVLTLAAPQPSSASTILKNNEEAASLKQRYPGRFLFCAALPLPDVDAAIK